MTASRSTYSVSAACSNPEKPQRVASSSPVRRAPVPKSAVLGMTNSRPGSKNRRCPRRPSSPANKTTSAKKSAKYPALATATRSAASRMSSRAKTSASCQFSSRCQTVYSVLANVKTAQQPATAKTIAGAKRMASVAAATAVESAARKACHAEAVNTASRHERGIGSVERRIRTSRTATGRSSGSV